MKISFYLKDDYIFDTVSKCWEKNEFLAVITFAQKTDQTVNYNLVGESRLFLEKLFSIKYSLSSMNKCNIYLVLIKSVGMFNGF